MSYLNTNLSEKSGLTVETNRATNSGILSQVSRQLEELKSDLNKFLEVINSPIAAKELLPSIENAISPTKTALNAKWDQRSGGLHQSEFAQPIQKRDLRSDELHQSEFPQATQERNPRSGGPHPSEFAHAAKKSDGLSDGLYSSDIRPLDQKCNTQSDRRHLSKVSQMV